MSLPLPTDFAPMEADTAKAIPTATSGNMSRSGTAFAASRFAMASRRRNHVESRPAAGALFPGDGRGAAGSEGKAVCAGRRDYRHREADLDFDALLQRIHPAESRIKKLAKETPATFMVFDLLVNERGEDLTARSAGRAARDSSNISRRNISTGQERIRLSPRTRDFETAKTWFKRMAGPLDGVIAKRVDRPYGSGERKSMLKIKNLRTADCVVGGFRYGTKERSWSGRCCWGCMTTPVC